MDSKKRNIINELEIILDSKELHRPVILIEGVRQAGKTTAVKRALERRVHLFIDLEKEQIFREKIDSCREFKDWEKLLLDTYQFKPGEGKILVVDEAQESSRLGSFVRYMKEDWAHQTTVLLGSLMSRLFRDGVREPVGRTLRVTVYPFSFKEFLSAHEKENLVEAISSWQPSEPFNANRHQELISWLQTYLQTGGLPEVVNHHAANADWRTILHQLKIQYEEDFIRVFGAAKLSLFQRILKRVAETAGYPSKKATIVNAGQKGYAELDDMLSQMERWHLLHRVTQESYQPTKSGKLLPKRYLFDPGMLQFLSNQARPFIDLSTPAPTEVRTPLGGLLENFGLCELLHLKSEGITGWRYKTNGSEIDFVMNSQGNIFPVEVKSSLGFRKDYLSPLKAYMDLYKIKKGFLADLTPGDIHQEGGQTICQIPLYCISEVGRL